MFAGFGCLCLFLSSLTVSSGLQELQGSKNIGKCCGRGEIISVGRNFSCVNHEISTELRNIETTGDDWMRLDECPESGEISIKKLSDFVDKGIDRISGSSACLDLLEDEGKLGVIPVVLHCKKDSNDVRSLQLPKFAKFRVCCPRGLFYDARIRDCVPNELRDLTDIADFVFDVVSEKSVEFSSFVRGPPQCKHAIVDYVIDRRDLEVLPNGTLRVSISSGDDTRVLLTEENSCLDGATPSELILRLCTGAEYCRRNACVRKCCPEGQVRIVGGCQTISQGSVTPGEFHRELEEFSRAKSNETEWKPLDTDKYGLLIGEPPCKDGKYPIMPDELPVIDSHGYIHVHVPVHERHRHHEYCLEIFRNVTSYDDGLYPAVCFPIPAPPEPNKWRFGINAALELTSCMFLLITFLVYIFLPRLQNLHGKTLMCHVASLFVAYGCLATVALVEPPDLSSDASRENNDNNEILSRDGCKFLGYMILFSFLAAFSWLNVMCFDIWSTFGGIGGYGGKRGAQRKRFFLYSLYAWGLAFILACLGVAADYTSVIPKHLRPNIGAESCWFWHESSGVVIFFIAPITIQLVANVVFFVLTSLHCSRVKAEITRVMGAGTDSKSRRFHSDKSKLILNIKLFIVMGISWIMEIVSTILNRYGTDFNWKAEFFYVSDALNCLQGVLIFILFVLKKKVYHALRQRLKKGDPTAPGRLNATLQDPSRTQKSASCSTLSSMFPVSNAP